VAIVVAGALDVVTTCLAMESSLISLGKAEKAKLTYNLRTEKTKKDYRRMM